MNYDYSWVVVKTNSRERFFLKCQELNIFIFDLIYLNDKLKIKILNKDLKKLKKIWFIKIEKIEQLGLNYWKNKWQKYHIFIIALILGLILLFCLSHIMLSVSVIHSNQNIRFIVTEALKERGIKENTWRKSYDEIEGIKQEILDLYPEDLEWLEIEVKGLKYIVRVEERKIESEKQTPEACNIVATKDGIIKDMLYSQGEALYKRNDSVTKGDILISGTINKDSETTNYVCATGSVFAEVWYSVKASVPLSYETKEKTGKVRWNIRLKNNGYNDFLFKSRLENYVEEDKNLFTLFKTDIIFAKQFETINKTVTMNEEEALNKALDLALEKISATLEEKEKIIDKKVLKKEVNNSTMNREVFVSVLEQIGTRQEFSIVE